MTKINLLPWREQKREFEKRMFTVLFCLSIVFSVLIIFLINFYTSGLVNTQIVRNQMLQNELSTMINQLNEIRRLEKTREKYLSRILKVRKLHSMRTLVVHFFYELINVLPSEVYITRIERKNDLISLVGYSVSNTYIAILMKKIANNEWFTSPVLDEIKRGNEEQRILNEFKINFWLLKSVRA